MRRATHTLTMTVAVIIAMLGGMLILTSGVSHAATVDNAIKDYAFNPADLTVKAGDTVTWTNGDKAPHTVTSSGKGPLDSPNLQTGDKFSYTFTSPGEFAYYCAVHPDMVGKVTVVAAEEAAPPPSTTTTSPPMDDGMGGHDMQPAPTPPAPTPPPAKQPDAPCSASLLDAMLTPFFVHFDKAHLETSLGQQVSDATNVDQYIKTHTVLVEAMYTPLIGALLSLPTGLDPFITHLDKAHLETSLGQQISDATDIDQYVKTHTVLVENMLAPPTTSVAGTC